MVTTSVLAQLAIWGDIWKHSGEKVKKCSQCSDSRYCYCHEDIISDSRYYIIVTRISLPKETKIIGYYRCPRTSRCFSMLDTDYKVFSHKPKLTKSTPLFKIPISVLPCLWELELQGLHNWEVLCEWSRVSLTPHFHWFHQYQIWTKTNIQK